MKNYYECHITMLGDPKTLKPIVERTGWKFSAIDGDIVTGPGVKCYATKMYSVIQNEERCLQQLMGTSQELKKSGVKVIRRKIERVIYDDRIGGCDGSCCGGV